MADPDQEQARDDERGGRPRITDAVRKAVSSGFKAAAASDEWVRGVISDAMPKEVVSYIKRATDVAKDEVVRVIASQTKKFLEGIDVSSEVQKILTALSFEIKTEIRFIPNDQKVKPDVKVGIRTKRAAKGKKKREPAEEAPPAEE